MTANVTEIRGGAPGQPAAEGKKAGAGAASDHALPAREQHPGIGDQAVGPTGADADKAVTVREIKEKNNDSRGVRITKVYIKQSNEYAIYKCNGEIMVAYADDPDKARRQRKLILPLARDRFELNYFLKGLNCREACERQLANGLQLALEGDLEGAKRTIAEAKTLVLAKRGARGRFQYLYYSCGAAVILMLSLLLARKYLPFHDIPIDLWTDLWLAAEAGLVGAAFSIALAIKSRTVALDTEPLANAIDGVLRLSIGVICAGVLVLLAASNVLRLTIGDINFTGRGPAPQAVLIIGFLAGFLERLVPDLLEKATKSTTGKPGLATKP
jgi:hypothetical protein